jgi:hypothetical protein
MPPELHPVADLPAVVRALTGGVLLQRDEAHARRQLDDHLRRRAHVDALDDRPVHGDHPVLALVEPDLLGAHGDVDVRALRALARHGRREALTGLQLHAAVVDRRGQQV